MVSFPREGTVYNMPMTINGDTFTTFEDLWNDPDLLTQAEKDEIQLKTALVGKRIEAQKNKDV